MSVRSRVVSCLGAGIFLPLSVFAQAAQDQEKTSGSPQILPGGPGHTAQESVERPELHRGNPRVRFVPEHHEPFERQIFQAEKCRF